MHLDIADVKTTDEDDVHVWRPPCFAQHLPARLPYIRDIGYLHWSLRDFLSPPPLKYRNRTSTLHPQLLTSEDEKLSEVVEREVADCTKMCTIDYMNDNTK